eukprot:Hpha_TRINITY_DN18525_c0_g1::TRINITY_DN18525_c0_g1_i1::g.195241::m.195241
MDGMTDLHIIVDNLEEVRHAEQTPLQLDEYPVLVRRDSLSLYMPQSPPTPGIKSGTLPPSLSCDMESHHIDDSEASERRSGREEENPRVVFDDLPNFVHPLTGNMLRQREYRLLADLPWRCRSFSPPTDKELGQSLRKVSVGPRTTYPEVDMDVARLIGFGGLDEAHEDLAPWELGGRLWISTARAAACKKRLRDRCITHIVRVADDVDEKQVRAAQKLGIQLVHLALPDDQMTPILDQHLHRIRALYRSVLNSEGSLLIHCHAGVNRSATLCIALLMVECGVPLLPAVDLVAVKRGTAILNNLSFRRQLVDLGHALDMVDLAASEQSPNRDFPRQSPRPSPSASPIVEYMKRSTYSRPVRVSS